MDMDDALREVKGNLGGRFCSSCKPQQLFTRPEIILWLFGNMLSFICFYMPFVNLVSYRCGQLFGHKIEAEYWDQGNIQKNISLNVRAYYTLFFIARDIQNSVVTIKFNVQVRGLNALANCSNLFAKVGVNAYKVGRKVGIMKSIILYF